MRISLAILSLAYLAVATFGMIQAAPAAAPDAVGPPKLEGTIPLDGVTGRIDHMAVDLPRGRLIVAELGNGTVDVVDVGSRKRVHRFTGLSEPQGVAYAAKGDLIAVACAGDGAVYLFHAADFTPAGVVALGSDADNIRIDPLTGAIVVGYGAGGLAIIDPNTLAKVADITLKAHPEGFQIDGAMAFVNLPDAGRIAVVDLDARQEVASWPTIGRRSNFPMALGAHDGVAVVFRGPSELVIFDRPRGTVRQSLPICDDADDVFFDRPRARYVVSCGAGRLDVVDASGDALRIMPSVETASGARTSLLVPELDRLFVARRANFYGFGTGAAILVYRP